MILSLGSSLEIIHTISKLKNNKLSIVQISLVHHVRMLSINMLPHIHIPVDMWKLDS